jgi:hypothetical protein
VTLFGHDEIHMASHLEASGFVIMKKPIRAIGAGDNPGRRGFEG